MSEVLPAPPCEAFNLAVADFDGDGWDDLVVLGGHEDGIIHPDDREEVCPSYEEGFSEGMRFLNLPYAQQWAHCDRILATLDDDNALAADVERLAGELVLGEARAAQAAYGDALGITAGKPRSEPLSLAAPLEAVRAAIVGYGAQLIALQADDPSRLPDVRRALAPIDDHRAAQARRPATTPNESAPLEPTDAGLDVTPDTPVPAIDDAPVAS